MITIRVVTASVLLWLPVVAWAQTPRPKPVPAAGPALETVRPVISQFEDGPPLAGDQKLVVGEFSFFRFGILSFKTADDGRVQVTGRVQVFDARGTAIGPADEIPIATSLHEEDKEWRPIFRAQFQLPGIAPPGTYKIRFEATDLQTKKKTESETTFGVAGRDVPLSPTLVVRDIGFYRTAEEETPLGVAAYRPGDSVWVRFDATGYKYGDQNAIDVTYDVAVLDSTGKQLFAQADAAVEKSQAFYPQPWVPGSFSLTLQPNMAKATYTIAVTARDAIGKQTVTEKADFKVE